jgi:PsbP-like protein
MRTTILVFLVLTVALSLVTASLAGKVAYGVDSSSAIPGMISGEQQQQSTQTIQNSTNNSLLTYENQNPNLSFTIQYPINWQRVYTQSVSDVVSAVKFCPIPSSSKTEICSPNAGIVTVTGYFSSGLAKEGLSTPGLANSGTLDGVTENKISNTRTNNWGFSLIDSSSTTLGGLQAHKLKYTHIPKGNVQNVTLQTIDLYALTDDNTLYDISFSTTPEKFNRQLPQAEQIINSFAIR